MTTDREAIARGLAAMRETAPPGVSVDGELPPGDAPAGEAQAPAAELRQEPGWLPELVETGLSLAVGVVAPPGTSVAQLERLSVLQPHERAMLAKLEPRLPELPVMDTRTLVLFTAAVILIPRGLAVVRLRRMATQRADALPPGADAATASPGRAVPPAASPAEAAAC